jgi:hypothetical protein
MNMCDLVVHLNEDLDQDQRQRLEAEFSDRQGIFSAHFSRKHPHMMTVAYDCDAMHSQDIVRVVEGQGWHAQAVGM